MKLPYVAGVTLKSAIFRFEPDDPRLPVILRALSDASSRSTGLLNMIPVTLGPRLGSVIARRLYDSLAKNRDGLVDILKVSWQGMKDRSKTVQEAQVTNIKMI